METLCASVQSSAEAARDELTLGGILRAFLPVLLHLLLRQPALSALPGRQKLAMARKADTESLTDHLLPLRLHSAGGTQFPDASQPA
jgi:hypothetical protein